MKKIEAIIRPEALRPLQQEVLALIERINRTGRIGDGKVFTGPLDTAHRIRTAEQGLLAI